MKKIKLISLIGTIVIFISACIGQSTEEELQLVEDGKTDNYYSNVAAEFEVSATIPLDITEEQYVDEIVRNDLAIRRITAVALYLTSYITDKFLGHDTNGDGEITGNEIFFRNDGYGEFHAMVRNQSEDDIVVTGDSESGYQVSFTIDIAGPVNLLSLIPRVESSSNDFVFEFKMPEGAIIDPDNVPRKEIRNFDPSTYDGEIENVRCTVNPLPTIGNAYPHFDDFFADGLFDLTLFYGYDYNESRSDLREAREAFNLLVDDLGFTPPVSRFEELKYDSGAFVKEAKANGKDIRVEVRIFHSDMFIINRTLQHDLALSEITQRDVFFYNGHAGPFYAFYLDANNEATVYYSEFSSAPFSDKQQIFIAQGCQTYSQYADMIYANEFKSEDNFDVITTINFSYGEGTTKLVQNFLNFNKNGEHIPVDYYQIISTLNRNWINNRKNVFYGIMGIDGNPQLHPYASIESIGNTCEYVSDCGDINGNVCIESLGQEVKTCGVKTLSRDACPEGTIFFNLASGNTIEGGACMKAAQ